MPISQCAAYVDSADTTSTDSDFYRVVHCRAVRAQSGTGTAATATADVVSTATATANGIELKVANTGGDVELTVITAKELVNGVAGAANYLGVGNGSTLAIFSCEGCKLSAGCRLQNKSFQAGIVCALRSSKTPPSV